MSVEDQLLRNRECRGSKEQISFQMIPTQAGSLREKGTFQTGMNHILALI